MAQTIHLEENYRPGIAILKLDRPPMNAISKQLVKELSEHLEYLKESQDTRSVIVWGGEKIFAAGADITEFEPDDPKAMQSRVEDLSHVLTELENLPQITISAVNGYAVGGGCELAIATDFRIAGDNAVFGQPEILLGIIPGAGATQRLPKLIGLSKAKELIYTGRQVKAQEALEIGLVDAVYPPETLIEKAIELADQYANGPTALRNAKRAIQAGFNMTYEEALDNECEEFGNCFETDDAKIGVASFLENGPGKATFTGR